MYAAGCWQFVAYGQLRGHRKLGDFWASFWRPAGGSFHADLATHAVPWEGRGLSR